MPRFIGNLFTKKFGRFIGYLRSAGTVTASKLTHYHFFRGRLTWRSVSLGFPVSVVGALSRFSGRIAFSTKPKMLATLSRFNAILRKRLRLRKRPLGYLNSRLNGVLSFVKYPWTSRRMFGTLTKRIRIAKGLTALLHFSATLVADKLGVSWFARLLRGYGYLSGQVSKRIRIQKSVSGLMQVLSGRVTFGGKRVHILTLISTLIRRFWIKRGLSGAYRIAGVLRFITTAIYRYPKNLSGKARFSGILYAESSANLIETLYYGPPNP